VQLDVVNVVLTDDWRVVVDETDQGRPVTKREYEDIDAFAGVIEDWLGVPVRVLDVESLLSVDRTLLICEESAVDTIAEHLSAAAQDVVPLAFFLNIPLRPHSTERVDRLGAAGAIERMRYAVWRDERADDPGGGIFGRKDVATSMGAHWKPSVLSETPRYAFFEHEGHPTLPDLLAEYLRSYSKIL